MALTQISTGGIKDDAVTDAKLPANSVGNSEMKDDAVGVAELSASGTAGNTTFLRGDNTWATPPDTDTNTQLSTEQVQDIVGAMFTGNTETNITATYEDGDGTIDLVASAGVGGANAVTFNDSIKVNLGTDADMYLEHDGTRANINNSTGALRIQVDEFRIKSQDNNEDFLKASKDGAVELYHNNVKKLNTDSGGIEVVGAVMPSGNISMVDSAFLKLGASDDLKLHHNGTDNVIEGSQHLIVKTTDAAKKIYLQSDAGIDISDVGVNEYQAKFINDGAVELYYDGTKRFETTNIGVTVTGKLSPTGNLIMPDNTGIKIGASDDLVLYHYTTDSTNRFESQTSSTMLFQYWNGSAYEVMTKMIPDGAVELYHNGNKKLATTSGGIEVTGGINLSTNLSLVDDGKIKLGTSDDLEIWHDGDHSRITAVNSGAGRLIISGRDSGTAGDIGLQLNADASEEAIICRVDQGVELYHNGTKQCETSATGLAFPSGKGIDFSATGDGNETDTSELFDDYEEGTWVPTLPNSGSASVATLGYARYTKTGRIVTWEVRLQFQASASNYSIPDNGNTFQIGGLPYNPDGYGGGVVTYGDGSDLSESNSISVLVWSGNPRIYFHFLTTDLTAPTNNWARGKWSNKYIILSGWYTAA